MRDVPERVRDLAALVSPRAASWRRFLRELPLDPESLDLPLQDPGAHDIVLCGSPRTGTTMLAGMLWQPPRSVTVMEPWDGMRYPPAQVFASLRAEMRRTGRLRRGRLDIPTLLGDGMVAWIPEGSLDVPVDMDDSTRVVVKWPAWWRFLDLLPRTKFIVTLRHPAAVVDSYRTASRRLAQGLDYDTAFNRRMNDLLRASTRDPARRRIAMFDHIHQAIIPHLDRPQVLAVRYERWFSDPDGQREELSRFLGIDITEGPVRLRQPSRSPDPATVELVRRHCRTGAALDYEL